ncbi:MAG: LicD family protein [Bacteroidales bacterium]|nr:LicD family protein [Bacteroidales bacterium]
MNKESLKKIWNVELDLLDKFKQICKKYNLNYCASSGTLLGAVRHKGFIPWDDDIDLFLPWTDYKKLLEVASQECQFPYFFQSFLTEKEGEASASRLRRSDTTGFTLWERENVGPDYDKGIFIDIFPLFSVPDSDNEKAIQKETIMFFWKCIRGHDALTQMKRGKVNDDYTQYVPYYNCVCKTMSIIDIKWAYLNACAMIDGETKEVGATSSRVHLPKLMWDTILYDSFVDLPFENTTIRCPANYEKVLDKQYGNWRVPVENGSRHEMFAVDTEIPWREFV